MQTAVQIKFPGDEYEDTNSEPSKHMNYSLSRNSTRTDTTAYPSQFSSC